MLDGKVLEPNDREPGKPEAAVITTRIVTWLVLLGSVWGVAEIFGKDLLTEIGVGGASMWLAVWAVLILSIGRGFWNKAGSSTLIGLVAALFKFIGPSPYACHLLGIASIAVFFDVFASGLLRRGGSAWWRLSLVGLLAAYGARTFFVAYSIHVARFERWVEGGAQMTLDHVVRDGTVVALAASVLAPVGFAIGRRAARSLSKNSAIDPVTVVER